MKLNLKTLSKGNLKSKLEELRKELMKSNAQISTGSAVKGQSNIKNIKKNIARIKTILNQEGIKPKQ
ncbi:50S ribosomal protein L29 [Candidatus Woesearchaeota archaeon]|nr:50S ribosomal protein L29 [Candidatus Woesearchaeota archaeon]MBL7050604.1 50S ribosomal protein L29 [Candidatus Woesearchaeota archaeon]